MDLWILKLLSALVILVIALVCGLWPIHTRLTQANRQRFQLGDAFAGGVFLGAALFHLLPDANTGFVAVYPHFHYPIAFVLCALGFVLLWGLERVANHVYHDTSHENKHLSAFILVLVLSIHSFIAGTALGISTTMGAFLILFFAILAHKGSASLALGISLRRAELGKNRMRLNLILFASLCSMIDMKKLN